MSSAESAPRRRSRSEIEDDEEADIVRSSQRTPPSTSTAKRARTNGYGNGSQSESPTSESSYTAQSQRHRSNLYDDEDEDSNEGGHNPWQPGAIVRVKLSNFVTYENAEFFPGPNLNMVIGPNGTGKSSLVCAICLGLGWGPKHLGRGGEVGEFVKHNMSDAQIEIELQRRPNEPRNHVVKLRIIRDGNNREWWLDGKRTSLKAVQELTKSLSIQVDNLCQFLPQDKVSEFAALSPVELLQQTQRAAAPEQMLDWHEKLKRYRKDQKGLELQYGADKETLEGWENRQQNLRAEVQRLQERQQIQEKVNVLKKTIPFVEYRDAVNRHREFRDKKKAAQERLKKLEKRLAPTLASVTQKKAYRDQIIGVAKERKNALHAAESDADKIVKEFEILDEKVQDKDAEFQAERTADVKRKQEVDKIERSIRGMRARLNDAQIEFDAADWNERVRAKEHEGRDIAAEHRDATSQNSDLSARGKTNRAEQEATRQELADFDSQEGQQMNKIGAMSRDTAKAWKWVQDHQGDFEQEVYGPPMISCSIKDPKYTDSIESMFQRNDMLAITAQTKADWNKLSNTFFKIMKLADVTIRSTTDSLADFPAPRLSASEMQSFGFDHWALDLVDGPEPVLAMLCSSVKLFSTAIGLKDITEDQHNMITRNGAVSSWVVGNHNYRVSRRAEYGSGATSTTTKNVAPARFWTDRPVDGSRRREIEARIASLVRDYEELKEQVLPVRERIAKLKADLDNNKKEVADLKKEKAELQTAYNLHMALPSKIEREEETLNQKKSGAAQFRQNIRKIQAEIDKIVLQKAQLALDHKDLVSRIRICHTELLDAEIRLVEARSDVEALEARNEHIVKRLEEERQAVKELEIEAKKVKEVAQKALEVCQEIRADPESADHLDEWGAISNDLTVDHLEMEIAAEESKLEYIHANNPNAIRDFEKRQKDVDKLKEKIAGTEEQLGELQRRINHVRGKWEPELDKLIAEISDAFSYNFEQIGCAGEVGVHKDDDFEQWAIQIKVKFRENETLQILDQHRQSGGERSVSTIFYLMSLQSLARAPFRVVDEINQGMDPRNERMVHERMVEIACKEHTSQYFLITPKLLTGLRYDKRMKVLCIASGEHMPENYKKLDVSKIIGIRRAIMAAG